MPHPRRAPRRRGARSCRLVRQLDRPRGDDTRLAGWRIGVATLRWCKELFPWFYEAHIAGLALSPATLKGVAEAFLSLVDEHLSCSHPWELTLCTNPADALTHSHPDGDPLNALVDAELYLAQPHIELYGIGINDVVDDEAEPALLTVAIWHLLSSTRLSPGINLDMVAIDERYVELIHGLEPLRSGLDPHAFLLALRLAGPGSMRRPSWETLLRYTIGQTDNEMANTSDYELSVVYGGTHDTSWGEFWSLVGIAAEARQIANAYHRLARWVDRNPEGRLPRIAAVLHEAAAASLALEECEAEAAEAEAAYADA